MSDTSNHLGHPEGQHDKKPAPGDNLSRLESQKMGKSVEARRHPGLDPSTHPSVTGETGESLPLSNLQRNFSMWSVLGLSFSLANSWFGISTALSTGINSGGPVQLVYGLIIITLVAGAIAASLSELASSMPHAGGQYYWAAMLAPPKYARGASYLTGFIAWTGSLFTCASIALGVGNLCLGCIKMAHPDL